MSEPIAIIGSGYRLPGNANTPSTLWDLLVNPRDLLQDIPEQCFNTKGFYYVDGNYHGHTNVQKAYFLDEPGRRTTRHFDAQFFGISPAEASTMDPQMRLLLETVYEALESAGQSIQALQGSNTAVYTGLMAADYEHIMGRDENTLGPYHVTGTSRALLSNRLSFFFDWHGPSMTIDTACSSSLYAVHYAVQQLRSGASKVAVVAGSNLILDPINFITESKLQMLSPNGRGRMWDAEADGYARGEGVAVLVLKTLATAEADRDNIECVIRETAVNQDGRTKGITMPSANAQTALIRDCYSRAGLNLQNVEDQPQFFEAHGTGTPAGDPVEAEAISLAFPRTGSTPLYVGSVKTIIGHTEGTAGIAGILKASLALQNSVIPPNLLFERLNPRVKPFYAKLCVPTECLAWPDVSEGTPRRASVNSFGFGGANAHAILESYHRLDHTHVVSPFVISAASEVSLTAYATALKDYINENHTTINLADLSYTLHSRRSHFQHGLAVTASTPRQLAENLGARLVSAGSGAEGQTLGVRSRQRSAARSIKPRVLAIFTGQGVQWARMGAELILRSVTAKDLLSRLDARLARLPFEDRPAWSLTEELLKDERASRIEEAELSQPLCTAIQILLVDVLRATNVKITDVVGHSSGEIAALYAAGILTAEDAICIAYYRGMHAHLANGNNDEPGAMMAVGSTYEDIMELLSEPEFQGHVTIAAINSSSSITLSGDRSAIEELKDILHDENKFARILKVGKAYHSHHMVPCSAKYQHSIRNLAIKVHRTSEIRWFSSVCEPETDLMDSLSASYWDRNMLSPVLFMQALERACKTDGIGRLDVAIEVGAHPALKGPASQTLQEMYGQDVPYSGLLERFSDDIEAVSNGLGHLWAHLGSGALDFDGFESFVFGTVPSRRLIRCLPPYQWNHEREYWHESRTARFVRHRSDAVHEILGHLSPESTDKEMRWKHVLRPTEITWMQGHRLQGQIVFPAAGYVVSALEAAVLIAKQRRMTASIVEVIHLHVAQALTFDSEDHGVEILVSVTNIEQEGDAKLVAQFTYNAETGKESNSLSVLAKGSICVHLGTPYPHALAPRGQRAPDLVDIAAKDFYNSLAKLEYHYSGPFEALSGLKRRLGDATGYIKAITGSQLLVHPAALDAALQTILLANSYPGDGVLWSMHVPTRIERVAVNLALCTQEASNGDQLAFDSTVPTNKQAFSIVGDVDIFPEGQNHAVVQIQGLECVPFTTPSAEDDRLLFSSISWGPAVPDAETAASDGLPTHQQYQLACLLERMAYFYLRALEQQVPLEHPSRRSGAYLQLYRFASHSLASLRDGRNSFWDQDWEQDTVDTINSACKDQAHIIDVRFLRAIGEKLPDIAMGHAASIEIGMKDNLLTQYYQHGLGMGEYCRYLSRVVKQITHSYPRLRCLEIGAGTGGATRSVLLEAGQTFSSYTFTDISSGFFEVAQKVFAGKTNHMDFKVLDISQDPCVQGFERHSYDLIIASAVLHATPSIRQKLQNIRRLLRPGGYLAVIEVQAEAPARVGTMFGAFSGWWLGAEEGRDLSPCLRLEEWDDILRQVGFSGCDTTTPDPNPFVQPMTLFVSQAVDDKISFLRNPLCYSSDLSCLKPQPLIDDLIILGGSTLRTAKLSAQLKLILGRYCGKIQCVKTLPDMQSVCISSGTTVLSFVELDQQLFKRITVPGTWDSLRTVLQQSGDLLWVSQGRRSKNCHSNMTIGLLRAMAHELPGLNIQSLDFEDPGGLDARLIAECLLRFKANIAWQRQGVQTQLHNSIERELVIEDSGRLMVPRLAMSEEMNDRYNSSRRGVLRRVDYSNGVLKLIPAKQQNQYFIVQEPQVLCDRVTAPEQMLVQYSFPTAFKTIGSGLLFLGLGTPSESNEIWVSLSMENRSEALPTNFLRLSEDVVSHLGSKAGFLYQVSLHHLASRILEGTTKGDGVLLHDAEPDLTNVIKDRAKNIGVTVSVSTVGFDRDDGNLQIHPFASHRTLRRLRLDRIVVFVDFSRTASSKQAADHVRSFLPDVCRLESRTTLCGSVSRRPAVQHHDDVRAELEDAVNRATRDIAEGSGRSAQLQVFKLKDITKRELNNPHQSVLEWINRDDASIQVSPIDSGTLFSSCKTYWLVGLTSSLGRSLCSWMVRHGARYIVMSSRAPRLDESWLHEMSEQGAVVRACANDVTNKDALESLYAEICATMPQIAGVAQGAMVLDDMNIGDMSLEAFQRVTQPKVEGSIHLDSIFHGHLDFLIYLSSISSIIGIPGQSAYAAANMFMLNLAEQRRRRGLAASVVHIGPILGAGYITDTDHDTAYMLHSMASMHLSEHDFHQLFAEGIIAGSPESASGEITAGIRRARLSEVAQPKWSTNPMMGHMLITDDDYSNTTSTSGKSHIPLERQLTEARSKKEIQHIVREAILKKLSVLFRLDADTLASDASEAIRLDEIGIDSFMAVEIRGWLMQNLKVNFPVLKILSGISIGQLIGAAVEGVTPAMAPKAYSAATDELTTNQAAEEGGLTPDSRDDTASLSIDTPISSTAYRTAVSEASGSESSSSQSGVVEPAFDDYDPRTKLHPARPKETFDLSYTQRMFWFSSRLFEDDTSLNHTALFRLTGPLRTRDLTEAVYKVGQDHESLRTFIFTSRDRLEQGVMHSSTLRLEHCWISKEEEAFAEARRTQSMHYHTERGQTLRLKLLSVSSTNHFLILGGTGLVMDGLSSQVFLRDLARYYNGPGIRASQTVPQYRDFVRHQNQAIATGGMEAELAFWKAQYSDFPPPLPVLQVSQAMSRPTLTTFSHVRWESRVGLETKRRIRDLCRHFRVTPFHYYLSCLRALISRLTDTEDVSIGIGDAHRLDDDAMNCIGSFFNVLPLRFRTSVSSKFSDVLRETCEATYKALEHSRLPFQALLDQLDAPRSATSTPLFQIFIDYRQGQREKQTWGNCDLEMLSLDISKTGYDLNLDIIDDPDGDCMLMLFIRSDLYTAAEASTIMDSYEQLVKAFASNPKCSLSAPEMFKVDQIQQSAAFSHGQHFTSKWPDTVIHQFEAIARAHPDNIAIRGGVDQLMSYSDLFLLHGSISTSIAERGVKRGSVVAVLQEPTASWIASILAIMRLGAVYLPLDPSTPWPRLSSAVKDCKPCLVLVDNETETLSRRLEVSGHATLNVKSLSRMSTKETPKIACRPDDTALMLYTSGSTGAPKGIMLKHAGIRNHVEPLQETFGISEEVVLQQSSCSFDLSYSQVFTAICFGGRICTVPRDIRGDALSITALMVSEGVTYTLATPTEYIMWLQFGHTESLRDSSWAKAICAGEQCSQKLLAQFNALHKNELKVFNAYGPTEASVLVTAMELQYKNVEHGQVITRIPAGKVLPNYALYVLDEGLHILPPGVQGEIYLGGAGIASGYVNNPELTSEKFLADPLASNHFKSQGWTTMHRVGDLGRWTADGSIVIESRVSGDTQVKIHGIRLDVREVEEAIVREGGEALLDAAVSLRTCPGNQREFLVAHVVFRSGHPAEPRPKFLQILQSRLRLPDYMCPAVIVPLEEMPRTLSSKLDRRAIGKLALPDITWKGDDNEHGSNLTSTEARLRDIWVDLIPELSRGLHRVNSETDFFNVGGTSLLLMGLQAEIRKAFDIRVPVVEMFQSSSLGGIAGLIEKRDDLSMKPINWDEETALPDACLRADLSVGEATTNDASVVVLTGATGHLGRAILQTLLEDENVKEVHCIGIRNLKSRADMVGLPKVRLHEGDLTLPRLGLTEETAQNVFASASRIIHNGAEASHMRQYQSLRLPNLQSTKELVEMAANAGRRIPIHYISTTTLSPYFAAGTLNEVFPPVSLWTCRPHTDGFGGYPATKWASEHCLERLHQHWLTTGGWPIFIHRPSLIARAKDDPALDVVHNVRYFARLMRAVPIAPNVAGYLDEVPLNKVVDGIVAALHGPDADLPGVRFRHYCGVEKLQLSDMRSWIMGEDEDTAGNDPVEEIPLGQWATRAADMGMDPGIVAWVASVAGQRDLRFPMVVDHYADVVPLPGA